MANLFRKLILLVLFITAIFKTIDFGSKDFDPLRQQWDYSLGQITSHRYFGEYVSPIQDKVQPVILNFKNDFISPSVIKVNALASNNYQTYLSKHIESILTKLQGTTLYAKVLSFKPLLLQYQALVDIKYQKFSDIATKYVAIGFIETQKGIKVAYNHFLVFFHSIKTKVILFVQDSKPKVESFHKAKVIPLYNSSRVEALKLSKQVKGHVKKWIYIIKVHFFKFYDLKVSPLVETTIKPKIQTTYNVYLKKYVDISSVHVVKFYNKLRLERALSVSKELITGSYDQLLKQLKEKDSTPKGDTQEPVHATIEDATELEDTETIEILETPTIEATEVEIETPEGAEDIEPEQTETIESEQTENAGVVDAVDEFEAETDDEEVNDDDSGALETKNSDPNDESVVLSLGQEVANWRIFIEEKIDSFFSNFDRAVNQIENELLEEIKPKLTTSLREFSTTLQSDYNEINKAIYNINSTTVLLENGEEAEVDKTGKIIGEKVTREDFRELLAVKKEKPTKGAEAINLDLRSYVSRLENAIDEERKIIVDIYEEFAEVAINEFSKKMLYSTYSNSFEQFQNQEINSKDDKNYNDWREYIKAKNYILNKREELINKKQDLPEFNKYLGEIQLTLKTFIHEAGNYYAILRAKANIEFQERESKELDIQEKLESEETFTTTSTLLKYVTIEIETGETQINEVPIEIPQEEEVSEDESDRDFETGEEQEESDIGEKEEEEEDEEEEVEDQEVLEEEEETSQETEEDNYTVEDQTDEELVINVDTPVAKTYTGIPEDI